MTRHAKSLSRKAEIAARKPQEALKLVVGWLGANLTEHCFDVGSDGERFFAEAQEDANK